MDEANCLTVQLDKDSALIMGDSHAANLWSALQDGHVDVHFLQGTAVGCRPLHKGSFGALWCLKLNDYLFNEWLPGAGSKVKWVILAGCWEASEAPELQKTVSYLQKLGKKVVVIGPTPEYFMAVPLMLAYENVTGLSMRKYVLKKDRLALDHLFKSILIDSDTTYYSMVDKLCLNDDTIVVCQTIDDEQPIWSDRDHFTAHGAKVVMGGFQLP